MTRQPSARRIYPSVLYFGTPVALVSTLSEDGSTNLSPLSSVWGLQESLVLGLAPDGKAFENLRRCSDCVVNLPDPGLWSQIERIAPTTGTVEVPARKRDQGYVAERDKFGRGGFSAAASTTVQPDRVAECPLQMEATAIAMHRSAAAGKGSAVFAIVEVAVQAVWAHDEICSDGRVDPAVWQPLLYVWRHYLAPGAPVGRNFRADA